MNYIHRTGWLAFFAVTLVFPWLLPNPAVTTIAVATLLYAAVAAGWNIFSGYTGYISLGHGAFFGIGAYSLAIMCQDWNVKGDYFPFLLLPLAGLLAALCALPFGWIALRTRRQTFVVITIAFFFITQLMAYNLRSLTNGSTGLTLPIPSWSGDFFNVPFYYVSLAVLLLALAVSWWIRHSKYGLGLLAIRDDEGRALGLGVSAEASKLVAFAVSAWFAGVGGGIYAYFVGAIYPPFAFDPTINVGLTLMALIGGLGTLAGPILGAVMVSPVQQYLVLQYGENGWYQMIYGVLFLVVLLALPEGIIPTLQKKWSSFVGSFHKKQKRDTALPVTGTLVHEENVLAKPKQQ
ncbi:MAG: branched-chain amino acid ABC transporter permease [Chloroflexi bacterium]|nr:branched-chain amino acid ABC transporter permease [Chloroflexota bacterium]